MKLHTYLLPANFKILSPQWLFIALLSSAVLIGAWPAEAQTTPQDRDRTAAQQAFSAGERLREQKSAAALRQALEKYQESLRLWRTISDRAGEASALSALGAVYDNLSEKQQALAHYQQALPLWRVVGDHFQEAESLHDIGSVYRVLGETSKALNFLNQTLPLRRAIGDRQGEAYTLNNIALVYDDLGERQKALDHYRQSLAVSRAAGDRLGEAQTLGNIGAIYAALGDRQGALDFLLQALPLRRAIGDRQGEAYTLNNIGLVYRGLGEMQKALDHYNLALPLWREVGDRSGEAMTLNNISVVYGRLGDRQKMLDFLLQSLPLRRATGDRKGEAYTLTNIGSAHQLMDEVQKAREYHQQALLLMRAVADSSGEAAVTGRLAHLERERGNLDQARAHAEAALNIIESLRVKVVSPELRTTFFASVRQGYEFYIDLLMRQHQRQPNQGHDATALEASERARARSLLEMLAEARADIRQGVDEALLARSRALQQQLNAKEQSRAQLLSRQHNAEQAAAVEREVRDLLTQFQEAQAQIRAASPRYTALTQPQPLKLAEIQRLLDDDTLLLEYALGEKESYLWAVTRTAMTSHALPKRAEIEQAVREVRDLITASAIRDLGVARQPRLAEASTALSRMLLSPVASQLGAKRLLIVAEGALQYLPFAALPEPQSGRGEEHERGRAGDKENPQPQSPNPRLFTPLIVSHEIVNLPSASTLAVLRRDLAERKPAAKTIAVLADPVFDKDDERVKSRLKEQAATEKKAENKDSEANVALERALMGAGDRATLSRLQFSRREAEAILGLAPAGTTMKALDFEASRAMATSTELGQYRIVHFATHGLLHSQHPELSGVVLSLVDEQGRPQDGFLRLHDIYNLNLPVELVVLSACQTGLGKEIKGEGLIGLTRGFMYAGAPRVVVSLWRVSDEATQELMKRFYRGMLGEKRLRPAEALRAAQVEMWKEQRWSAPYYWAAFVIQGEWASTQQR